MSQGIKQAARTFIHALGHYHPPEELPNSFFDQLGIDSNAAWIEERTGIQSRRTVLSKDDIIQLKSRDTDLQQLRDAGRVPSIADIAEPAWKMLQNRLDSVELKPEALICGTSIPDFDIPANGCSIAARLGLQIPSFDTNSACSSFVVDIHVTRGLLNSALYKTIAVFNPERYSLRTDFSDRASCVLFGDGCATALVSSEQRPGSLEVIDTMIDSDPSGFEVVKVPDNGYFSQNGKAVQKFAISRTIEATKVILERNQLEPNDVSYFTGHQANLRMVMSAAERLGLSSEKHLYNVHRFGNQGAAGAPAVLSMNWDVFQPGDKIVVAVVGSGLTWGSMLLQKT
ncbi:MAG: 3-oxoacyl-ACP synthase III family protein [Oligoflexus sp.]